MKLYPETSGPAVDSLIQFSTTVASALQNERPVVALESTVIAHGLPRPHNLDTALECEAVIAQSGGVPATVGIVAGIPTIGLSREQLAQFASGHAPDGGTIEKVNLSNLSAVIAKHSWGATTVAGTIRIATCGGKAFDQAPRPLVFATGGIGGVHRGAETTFDISADLTALATMQIICVCAGAKAILDLPKTVEYLETMGVPIVGYKTDEFPAFYSRKSGLSVDAQVDSSEQAAELALNHWRTGGRGAVLVCVPIPEQFQLPAEEVDKMSQEAVEEAARLQIKGKAVTPFVLSRLVELSGGATLKANVALLRQNALVGSAIAKAITAVPGLR
ncbi:MAG: pseudouridine-5'-phosphate glycosidase [Blastocatellia bacterium]